jgi:peptide/nickel transport system ATP-binding protein
MICSSHDLSLLRQICDRAVIMYAGKIVEKGPAKTVLFKPESPYTNQLVASVSRLHEKWKI